MRVVIQRVKEACVVIDNKQVSAIKSGLLVFMAVEDTDKREDIDWLTKKIVALRIFDDDKGVMNIDVQQHKGDILVVSQFTLFASTKKGNRPSYLRSSKAQFSQPMYEAFVQRLQELLGKKVSTGVFGADMQVKLINDGPVTIIMDTKYKE